MSGYIELASGCATALATACTTRSESRVIDVSPAMRRSLICMDVRSSMVRWPNHVATPTATATTTEVVRISRTESRTSPNVSPDRPARGPRARDSDGKQRLERRRDVVTLEQPQRRRDRLDRRHAIRRRLLSQARATGPEIRQPQDRNAAQLGELAIHAPRL